MVQVAKHDSSYDLIKICGITQIHSFDISVNKKYMALKFNVQHKFIFPQDFP